MKKAKLFLALILLLTLSFSCKSDDEDTREFDSVGLIIGLDAATCGCCGNWIIEIEDEINPYQFLELPDDSGIDLTTAEFPLSVKLNWTESASDCKFAIISEIITN